jgi:hypothetical protein
VEDLREHLIRDHGRAAHEVIGPLAEIHKLEHFDQTMGLLRLGHHHLEVDRRPGEEMRGLRLPDQRSNLPHCCSRADEPDQPAR